MESDIYEYGEYGMADRIDEKKVSKLDDKLR